MSCGTTKQSQRTFHPHFLTCLGPTFCSINSGKVIVRFLWHWHEKDTGHSCLHHHFIFPKISPISRFSHLENFENSPIIFPYLMAILFMPFFFWPHGRMLWITMSQLVVGRRWGFFRGLPPSEMRSHILLVMFYEFYHGNSRSPSNHHLG